MAASEKRTFSLPAEQAAFIDAQVKAGSFASASEVVRAGLRALQERDAAVDLWLREEVAATFDRWKADPAGGLSPQDMAERMRRRQAERLKGDV
ncbi:type II toxin-antitoxin system ParD family antitoxin [Methylobacterium sp. J-076]|uniref:type II toxin-antitoxin system ParD family antitoxin n=1 Tax=Methylobacterium sp. J-076 TaxID=2836655 RepID=UPI001FB99350|nr:type II toxin-antitoxin system ParD family antitoxin [Methylobacterium sp. J-076]MCJ2012384.1 type II toxin-antitoxin system ParD family antitoxin [Methylobacterium sp. J-076]